MKNINIDKNYILDFTKKVMSIDSPSGFTTEVVKFICEETKKLGFSYEISKKGNVIIDVPSSTKNTTKTVALAAHVDTLGAMVRSISSVGTLKLTPIGGLNWTFVNGEYCKIYTRGGLVYTGTALLSTPSVHVYGKQSKQAPTEENIEIRLDEVVKTKDDVLKLGIGTGNFVCFNPRTVICDSGYIKSRFLDDKICVALLFGLLKNLKDSSTTLKCNLKIIISTYEEVGHGSASIPDGIDELIAIDMGCIGDDLSGSEEKVSICAKDGSGPYDYRLTNQLIDIAEKEKINHAVDIYPFYSSDASAALKGGNDVSCALIGPGVYASHGLERTHLDGVISTIELLLGYVK